MHQHIAIRSLYCEYMKVAHNLTILLETLSLPCSKLKLVTVTFLLTLALCRFNANLLVILLQSCEIFTCLRKLTLFHTLTHIPMHKGALGIHQIKFVVNAGEHFSNGR